MDVPPPGGSHQGSRDSASKDIGPLETEYGRAICCNAADSGTLWGDEMTGGGTGPPKMVGTDRNRLEASAGEERKSGGGGTHTHGNNCREENDDDGDTRVGKGNGGGGITGGQWLQWGGMERGGRLRHTLFFRQPEIHGDFQVAN